MATHHGKEGVVKVGTNTVAETRTWSINQSVETVDDSSQGDGWKSHLVGMPEWDGEMECWWDETDTTGQEALEIGESVTLNLYPMGAATGAKYYTGTATITRVGMSVPVDGGVSRSFSFKGNGALTKATVT
ncbi:phage tail tube protein [Vineibacter terrae]|nr:phage tail tube protein [Vineibacter terrae]